MSSKRVILPALFVLTATAPALRAGMSSYNLNDVVELRLQDISFFSALFFVSAFGLKLLWNYFAKEFPVLPKLNFARALVLSVVLGALMLLVLSMISGARELLTPGAWKKQGSTYRLADTVGMETRRTRLLQLFALLKVYAEKNGGIFPAHEFVSSIPREAWRSPDASGAEYLYLLNLPGAKERHLLVLEPAVFGSPRLAITAEGAVIELTRQQAEAVLVWRAP